jgi:tetratricopeptide (TPR) repeat protein
VRFSGSASAFLAIAIALFLPQHVQTQTANRSASVSDRAELLRRAGEARSAGQIEEAMRLFRLAAERHRSVQAYLDLARLQSSGGDAAAALETLAKAREIAPNSEDVLSGYAQLALSRKQYVPALLTLESLTRIYPTVAQYHYLLGLSLLGVGDTPSATEELSTANRLQPDHPLTLLALGLALNNRKQFDEARSVLTRSLDLQPDSPDTVAALAEAEAGLGRHDEAIAHAERALKISPEHATAHLVLGMVFMERRSYAEARDQLLKAAATDPDSPKAAYQLSLVYARLGDDAQSRHYLEVYQQKLRAFEDAVRRR